MGGIGGASKLGVLIKGSNYLETLADVDTVVFDKTGTLTSGTFSVTDIHPQDGTSAEELLALAAHAEAFSDHPIAVSIKQAYTGQIDQADVKDAREESGHGVVATVQGRTVCVGKRQAHGGARDHL